MLKTVNANDEYLTAPTKVRVFLRPFYFEGKVLHEKDVIDLPRAFALECVAANKAELVR